MEELHKQLAFIDSQITEAEGEMSECIPGSGLHEHFKRKRDGLREVHGTIKKLGDAGNALIVLFKAL